MRIPVGILLISNLTILEAATVSEAAAHVKPQSLIVNQAADAIVNGLKLAKPLGHGATREMAEDALRQ